MPTSLSSLINLSNSIIGVSLLTMPYCFQQCGILLSCVVLVLSAFINKYACHLLLKAAMLTRRRKLEYLAYQTLGYNGKLLIELGLIFFLLGGCVALFVVSGDLLPALMGSSIAQESRVYLMVFLAFFVAFPLSLRRNTESLTSFSFISMMFYVFLSVKMFWDSLPALLHGNWFHRVVWWKTDNLLAVLPIFTMALAGQPQVFEVFDLGSVDVSQMRVLDRTVSSAMHTCLTVYTVVGFCGYIGQYQRDAPIPGNSLLLLDDSWMSWVFRLGFIASLIMSFPLCLFPCRTSLHSVIYRRNAKLHEVSSVLRDFIPENRFKLLTIMLLSSTLGAALLIPRIELFLGITGATFGCFVCLVAPARIFLGAINGKSQTAVLERAMAQFVVLLGIVIMVLCSVSMLHRLNQPEALSPPSLAAHSKDSIISSNSKNIIPAIGDFPVEVPGNRNMLFPIPKSTETQHQNKESIVRPELKESPAPFVEQINSRKSIAASTSDVHKVVLLSNNTAHVSDALKYAIGDSKNAPDVMGGLHDPKGAAQLNLQPVVAVKPVSNPDISIAVEESKPSDIPPHPPAQVPKSEPEMPLVAKQDATKPSVRTEVKSKLVEPLELSSNVAKKDKDEIKLLEKIAEEQQEQKKMIEDIQKELKQEIALHKEIKANQSKENEFVEKFEEKIKRIDKHIQDVDKIGNKTLREIIEGENANETKKHSGIKIDKQKKVEFKGPLKILNKRFQENAKVAKGIESKQKRENKPEYQAKSRVEPPMPELSKSQGIRDPKVPIKPVSQGLDQNSALLGKVAASEYPLVVNKPKTLSSADQEVRFNQHALPREISRTQIKQQQALDKPAPLDPKKPVVIPVEVPALLSEVTKDQGPALMKDLDKSLKQDKQQVPLEDVQPVAGPVIASERHGKTLTNEAFVRNERKKNAIESVVKKVENRQLSNSRGKQEKNSTSDNGTENLQTRLAHGQLEAPLKTAQLPLVVKMNPSANNNSVKEQVHKEI